MKRPEFVRWSVVPGAVARRRGSDSSAPPRRRLLSGSPVRSGARCGGTPPACTANSKCARHWGSRTPTTLTTNRAPRRPPGKKPDRNQSEADSGAPAGTSAVRIGVPVGCPPIGEHRDHPHGRPPGLPARRGEAARVEVSERHHPPTQEARTMTTTPTTSTPSETFRPMRGPPCRPVGVVGPGRDCPSPGASDSDRPSGRRSSWRRTVPDGAGRSR